MLGAVKKTLKLVGALTLYYIICTMINRARHAYSLSRIASEVPTVRVEHRMHSLQRYVAAILAFLFPTCKRYCFFSNAPPRAVSSPKTATSLP